MSIIFKNRTNLKDVGRRLSEEREKRLKTILEQETGEIVRRTTNGKDYNNAPFKPYNKQYKSFREKKGRSTTPNLTLGIRTSKKSPASGMLKSITSTVKRDGSTLIGKIFPRPDQVLKVIGNNKLRPFFGLAKEQIERVRKYVKGT